jgi:hypothetical protein
MSAIDRLRNRITLTTIPFTERGSRLLLFRLDDQLYIKLAERWVKYEAEVGHYRKRPPFVNEFAILDSSGTVQSLRTETFPHAVRIHTGVGAFTWAFVNPETLMLALPEGTFKLRFKVHAQRADADRRGGVTRGRRNTAYTTNAQIISQTVTPIEGEQVEVELTLNATAEKALILHLTPRLGFNREVPKPEKVIDAALKEWEAWFAAAPPVLPEYQSHYDYAWWVMRAALLNTHYFFTREAATPSKIHYVGVWLWDQYFHAIAYRHVDAKLAKDQLRIFLDHQLPNGMLPDAIHDEGIISHLTAPVDADVTKPPFMAWAALKIYETTGDLDFLEEIYGPISRWQDYWHNYSMNANGLGEYQHPFSSGLDDSPLFDEGMPVVAPDLNTYLVIQADALARIAELTGQESEAAAQREKARVLTEKMNALLWDEERGYFHALRPDGKPVDVFTPFHLLPIWTGRLNDDQIQRIIGHLTSPRLWPQWPIPTVAVDDPKFDPMQMWRGPVWVNVNLLFVEALERAGQRELADELRRKSLALIMQHDDIFEYYNPLTAERPPKAAPIFGWTSAAFIELAIQETRRRAESQTTAAE